MDELVLPLKQDRITHQVHACAAFFAVFAALGWLTATPGLVPAFDRAIHRDEFEAGSVFLVVGLSWIAAAVFGYVIYQQVRTLRYSTGLRLTSEGFQFEHVGMGRYRRLRNRSHRAPPPEWCTPRGPSQGL